MSNPEPVVGLASAFVYSGALGCVGSLWPVYDSPAVDLAVRFYRYVLAGEPTGEALRHARADIRDAYPRESTWAGYVSPLILSRSSLRLGGAPCTQAAWKETSRNSGTASPCSKRSAKTLNARACALATASVLVMP